MISDGCCPNLIILWVITTLDTLCYTSSKTVHFVLFDSDSSSSSMYGLSLEFTASHLMFILWPQTGLRSPGDVTWQWQAITWTLVTTLTLRRWGLYHSYHFIISYSECSKFNNVMWCIAGNWYFRRSWRILNSIKWQRLKMNIMLTEWNRNFISYTSATKKWCLKVHEMLTCIHKNLDGQNRKYYVPTKLREVRNL